MGHCDNSAELELFKSITSLYIHILIHYVRFLIRTKSQFGTLPVHTHPSFLSTLPAYHSDTPHPLTLMYSKFCLL